MNESAEKMALFIHLAQNLGEMRGGGGLVGEGVGYPAGWAGAGPERKELAVQ